MLSIFNVCMIFYKKGALWIPGDGVVTAPDLAMVFKNEAKKKGVTQL